ncbi:MAG: SIS domain-containing protein [Chloroflexota bacterium]
MMLQTVEFDKTASVEWYFDEMKAVFDRIDREPIHAAIDALHQARLDGRQIFIMGNGGSASTATHMVCDLAKNTRHDAWPHYKVIGMADNMAIFSAYGNDDGYDNVFRLQLANLLNPGDIVVAISTSGNSPNVLRAVELANERGATVIGMTGFGAGKLGPMVDIHLHVPSECIEQVEDIHLMLEHLITKALREMTQGG